MLSITPSGIALFSLNNQQRHNVFDELLLAQWLSELVQIEQNAAIHVVLITAAGPYFCAGGDLHWMQRMGGASWEENREDAWQLAHFLQRLRHLSKPTIACVQGHAYGGGVGIIACCDIVLAVPNAHFCLSEVKLGLVPAIISPYLIEAIGERAVRRYALTAERFNAEQAQTLGLIHEVVTTEALTPRAMELAMTMLQHAPSAIRTTKQLIAQVAFHQMESDIITKTVDCLTTVRGSKEAQEGMRAFLEKRPPNWP